VPPISQWSNNYIFSGVGPLFGDGTHYYGVAAPANKTAGVRFDGAPIPPEQWVNVFGGAYKAHVSQISLDSHTLLHVEPNVGLQVVVYGYGQADSYAFPGGQRFAELGEFCRPTPAVLNDGIDNDCDNRVDEELVNGIDDDGDGLIDEDTAGTGDVGVCTESQLIHITDPAADVEPTKISTDGKCLCADVVRTLPPP